jgi:hypothetical protein
MQKLVTALADAKRALVIAEKIGTGMLKKG